MSLCEDKVFYSLKLASIPDCNIGAYGKAERCKKRSPTDRNKLIESFLENGFADDPKHTHFTPDKLIVFTITRLPSEERTSFSSVKSQEYESFVKAFPQILQDTSKEDINAHILSCISQGEVLILSGTNRALVRTISHN